MKIFGFFVLLCVLFGVAGFAYMTQWEPKVPTEQVEVAIDNERFFNMATNK